MNSINWLIAIFLCLVFIAIALFIIAQTTEKIANEIAKGNRLHECEIDDKKAGNLDLESW